MSNLKEKIIAEIKKIYDPEIPVNIYELGLIYKIEIKNEENVIIEMTLTSPNCPVAESLPKSVKDNILKIVGVKNVDLKLVWDPPWNKDKMSEAAKLELMEYAKDVKPNEEIIEEKGVKVLIDPKAIIYLLGTEMDYKKEKFSSQFVFNNPNETERCGCGESFKI